jgi:hypothetical protein
MWYGLSPVITDKLRSGEFLNIVHPLANFSISMITGDLCDNLPSVFLIEPGEGETCQAW